MNLGYLQKQAGILHYNDVIDTYELASVLMPTASRYNLGSLGKQLGILLPATHRALDDAKVTMAAFNQLFQMARELPLDFVAEIVRLSEPLIWDANWVFQEVLRLKASDLEIDLVTRKVTRGSHLLNVTAREFELLEYLLRHQNQIVSREMLTREVWKEPSRATSLDNVIDVHIARLRKKVDQDFPLKLIHTVRGVGFILCEGEP